MGWDAHFGKGHTSNKKWLYEEHEEEDEEEEEEECRAYGSDDGMSPPAPPDGGWGWLVVVGSFVCNFLVEGITISFAIDMEAYMRHFNASYEQVMWVGSILAAMYLLVGPFVAALCAHYGCRKVTMLGSGIALSGFALSTQATDIKMMIFCYGLIGGIGLGMIYLPAIVSVGLWFDKKRAFTTGIALAGAGFGEAFFPLISKSLSERYGWDGKNLILAGIVFNCAVCGMIFRPVDRLMEMRKRRPINSRVEIERGVIMKALIEYKQKERTISNGSLDDCVITRENKLIRLDPSLLECKKNNKMLARFKRQLGFSAQTLSVSKSSFQDLQNLVLGAINSRNNNSSCLNSAACSAACSSLTVAQVLPGDAPGNSGMTSRSGSGVNEAVALRLQAATNNAAAFTNTKTNTNRKRSSQSVSAATTTTNTNIGNNNSQWSSNPEVYMDGDGTGNDDNVSLINCNGNGDGNASSASAGSTRPAAVMVGVTREASGLPGFPKTRSCHALLCQATGLSDENGGDWPKKKVKGACSVTSLPCSSLPPHLVTASLISIKVIPNSIAGSRRSLRQRSSRSTSSEYTPSTMGSSQPSFVSCSASSMPQIQSMEDLSPNHNIVWKCGHVLWRMFQLKLLMNPIFALLLLSIMLTLLGFHVPYFYMPEVVASLGLYGAEPEIIFSIMGISTTVGRLAGGWLADRPVVNSLHLNNFSLIMIGVTVFFYPVCTSISTLAALAGIGAFFYGIFLALRTVLLVELLGLSLLTQSFGMLTLAQGIAAMFGPPIAGRLSDTTGSNDISFYLAGILTILAGLVMVPVVCMRKPLKQKSTEDVADVEMMTGTQESICAKKMAMQP